MSGDRNVLWAEPELGQLVFGNPIGAYESPDWVDALVNAVLNEIERVFWNKNQREWNRFEDPRIPGVEFSFLLLG